MTLHTPIDHTREMNTLAEAAAALGYEIVDIAGFLDVLEENARNDRKAIIALKDGADKMAEANKSITTLVSVLTTTSDQALKDVQSSVALVSQPLTGLSGPLPTIMSLLSLIPYSDFK